MSILANRSSRALIFIMIALVAIGILIASIYYRSANSSVDPRIVRARELYSDYNTYAASGNYYELFSLLDSVEIIYQNHSHYRNSYEMGVVINNRAASQITIALYRDSIRLDYNPYSDITGDSILLLAEENVMKAISLYELWMDRFMGKNEEEISTEIEDEFFSDFEVYDRNKKEKYLRSRSKEILNSVEEGDRRLSVCYTNLGVILRHRGEYIEAIKQYEEALKLWDRNLSAENNMNAMLGLPLKKRNLIQKLFPPDR